MTCTSVKWAHVTFSVFWSYRCSLWPQVSVCIPVLRLGRRRKKVLFYCHFPDQLLTQRKSALKKLYRTPIDWLEERTTGMADMVRNITHSNMVRLQDWLFYFICIIKIVRNVNQSVNQWKKFKKPQHTFQSESVGLPKADPVHIWLQIIKKIKLICRLME